MPDQQNPTSDRLNDILGLLAAGGAAKAIIPPVIGRKLPTKIGTLPDEVAQQLKRQGHEVTPEGIGLNVWRQYDPKYVGQPVLSGGTFYGLRGGDEAAKKFYSGRDDTPKSDLFKNTLTSTGTTWVKNPLVVNTHFGDMHKILPTLSGGVLPAQVLVYNTQDALADAHHFGTMDPVKSFMEQHAPVHNEIPGNLLNSPRLYWWMMDSALANKARRFGYDSIINYGPTFDSMMSGWKPTDKRVTELYDLRENRYPPPGAGPYSMWPQYQDMLNKLKNQDQ